MCFCFCRIIVMVMDVVHFCLWNMWVIHSVLLYMYFLKCIFIQFSNGLSCLWLPWTKMLCKLRVMTVSLVIHFWESPFLATYTLGLRKNILVWVMLTFSLSAQVTLANELTCLVCWLKGLPLTLGLLNHWHHKYTMSLNRWSGIFCIIHPHPHQ